MQEFARAFFRITLLPLARLIYRQRVFHEDRVPESGGVLLIANHVTYIDSFLIYGVSPRPVRFVIVSRFMKARAIGWFLRLFGAIPIQPGRPREAIRKTAEALSSGEVVCIFPEGQLTRIGTLLSLKKGYQLIAARAGAQVVPVYLDGLWDSIFSHEGGRHFWKWPRRIPCPVRIVFGEPADAEEAGLDWARSRLLALSEEAFGHRRELRWTLGEAAVRGLKRQPGAPCFFEHGKRRRVLKRGQVLAIAIALAERWRNALPESERRVGILLPPGWTPAVVSLALVFSGRVPVNLPFDPEMTDLESLASQLPGLGIRTVVTSKVFAGALSEFPWKEATGQFVDVGGELSAIDRIRVLMERILVRLEPKRMAVKRLAPSVEEGAEESEAYGMLPGDGSGPVLLPHRAVTANALQLTSGDFVRRHERVFCEMPLHSAAGSAFGLWLPILGATSCSCRSFSLQAAASMIETVLHEDGVTLLAGGEKLIAQLEELREPWHPSLRETFRGICLFPEARSGAAPPDRPAGPVASKTGVPVFRGLAPDWLGAVVSLNLPDKDVTTGGGSHPQPGNRDGSVGRLLPGIAAEIDSGSRLFLRGSCFAVRERVETTWSARFDGDGFLFLTAESAD